MRNPEVYDLVTNVSRGSWDISWYSSLLNSISGTVLELGSGTGRIFLPLLEEGIDIYGIELDDNMLAQARKKLALCHRKSAYNRLIKGDITSFNIPIHCSAVIAAYNTLASIHGSEQLNQMLACIEKHLQPKGLFAFDIIVSESLPWSLPPFNWQSKKKITVNNAEASLFQKGKFDLDRRLHQIQQTIKYHNREEESTEQLLLYQWDISNLYELLQARGWKLLSPAQNSNGQAYHDGDVVYAAQFIYDAEY